MAGCPGCLLAGKELQAQYDAKRKEAIQFAKDNETDVAIYRDIDGFSIIKAEIALSEGYQIKEIISFTG